MRQAARVCQEACAWRAQSVLPGHIRLRPNSFPFSQQRCASTESGAPMPSRSWQQTGMSDILSSSSQTWYRQQSKRAAAQARNEVTPSTQRATLLDVLKLPPQQQQQQQQQQRSKEGQAHRHRFPCFAQISSLIEHGMVIRAMTLFMTEAMETSSWPMGSPRAIDGFGRNPEVQANRIDQHVINGIVQKLAALAMLPLHRLTTLRQSSEEDGTMWMPPFLGQGAPSKADMLSVQPQLLAVYALASVYDVATLHQMLPSSASTARMLRAFALHLQPATFVEVMKLALLAMSGVPIHEAQLLAERDVSEVMPRLASKAIPIQVLASVMNGLGCHGNIPMAEMILEWWLKDTQKQDASNIRTGMDNNVHAQGHTALQDLPIHWWPSDPSLYSAMIRAYISNGDVVGSRSWLIQYRRVMAFRKEVGEQYNPSAAPFLEHLLGVTKVPGENFRNSGLANGPQDTGMSLRREAVSEIARMMFDDGMPLDQQVFGVILNFQVGTNQLEEAAGLFQLLVDAQDVKSTLPSIYKALFALHRRWAIRNGVQNSVGPFETEEKDTPLNSPRRLFCIVASHVGRSNKASWKPQQRLDVLNAALAASLAKADLPLALAIISVLERLDHVRSNRETWDTATTWIRRLSHEMPEQPQHEHTVSKTFVEASLRDTNGVASTDEYRLRLLADGQASEDIRTAYPDEADAAHLVPMLDPADCSSAGRRDSLQRLAFLRQALTAVLVRIVKSGLPSDDVTSSAQYPVWAQEIRKQLSLPHLSNDNFPQIDVAEKEMIKCAFEDLLINPRSGKCRVPLLRHILE